jgi:hypothetical protein
VLADVVKGADIGMIEGGSSLCFALKAAQGLRVADDLVRQKLQSDETVKASVFRFVDYTHPAAAELLDDAVVRDGLAHHCADAGRKSMKAREMTGLASGQLTRNPDRLKMAGQEASAIALGQFGTGVS